DAAGTPASSLAPAVQPEAGALRPEGRVPSWEAERLPATGAGSFAAPAPRVPPEGARAAVYDPRGDSTRTALDRWGLPRLVEDSKGNASTWSRNGQGQVEEAATSQGSRVVYRWEGPNLVEVNSSTTSAATTMTYDAYGQVESVTQDGVLQARNFYGDRGLLDSVRVGTSVTRYSHDARGRVLSVTDPEGHRSTIAYQSAGMQNTESASVIRGTETRTTTYAYDALGRVRQVTDPVGRTLVTEYDVLNRTRRVEGPDSTIMRYDYDDPARTYTFTDPKDQTYQTVTNALGWVESRKDPRGGVERYAYDRTGNVTRYTNRRQQQVTFGYDTQGRLRTRTADGRTTTFDYDSAGRWSAATNEEGTDTLRIDPTDRPAEAVTVRQGVRYVLGFSHTEAGLRNALTVTGPWGTRTMDFGLDKLQRLAYLYSFGHNGAGFKYTPDQLVGEINLPTGTAVSDTVRLRVGFDYTPLHATERIRYNRSAAEEALGRSYGYDALERIQSIVRKSPEGGTETRSLAYDALDRLRGYADVRDWITSEVVCADPMDATTCTRQVIEHTDTLRRESYAYDRAGNRTDRGAVVETGNRLVSFGGFMMEYDADGNLARKFQQDASGAITFEQRFGWSSLGQLESVTTNGSTTTFGYDGYGRRVRKSAPGGVARYLWDGDDLVAELDGAGGLVREYAYYPGIDQPHAMRRASDGAVFFYAQELPGHVAGLVARGNAVVNQYAYTPWG
ncbi:MAG: hypothetical protein KY444_11390, partial [Gemmatimonadetes bacterium]|nr:hypothetical protein [Gemmatimonadota bacterium]